MRNISFGRTVAFVFALALTALIPATAASAATVRTPSADGSVTYGNDLVSCDASHIQDGYIMVKYLGSAPSAKLRIQKDGESVDECFTYDLSTSGSFKTFPFTKGSGTYTVTVLHHEKDFEPKQYATIFNKKLEVNMPDDKMPFLYPNACCDYNALSPVVGVSDAICAGIADPLEKVAAVYHYTVEHVAYDYDKANAYKQGLLSGFQTDISVTLATGKGICVDSAALMTAMLRLQDIPTKLVYGFESKQYHAWVSVYTAEQGWIENIIQIHGDKWSFMDPTYASTGKGNPALYERLKNPENYYTEKHCF